MIWLTSLLHYLVLLKFYFVVSVLMYRFTTKTVTKIIKQIQDGRYKRMIYNVFKKSWKQQPKNPESNSLSHKLSKYDEKDMLGILGDISDFLLWIPTHGRPTVGKQGGTYIHQLSVKTWCYCEGQVWATDDRGG